MIDEGITARARYLDESAHLLASTSPAISRHLRSQLRKLATDQNLGLSDVQIKEACGACGNLMIPGWTTRTYRENGTSKRSINRNASRRAIARNASPQTQNEEAAVRAICHECLICNRVARESLAAPRKASKEHQEPTPPSKSAAATTRTPNVTHIPAKSGPGSPASSSTNASSRRRAKARKQSGLQALLAKKKEESLSGGLSTGFGLDLMDLMKTS